MSKKPQPNAASEVVQSVKGFDLNWRCRDYQFEVGKTYTHDGEVNACESGFHACEYPLDVFGYYAPGQSRYALVQQSGALPRHGSDTKVASGKITIEAELKLPDLIARAIKWIFAHAKPEDTEHATGTRGAASSTGDYGAASSTGDCGAASSTGYQGAASSTGDCGAASSTGTRGAASSTGDYGAAMAIGFDGRVMGAAGNALFLVHRDPDNGEITHAWAGVVGRDGIKPEVWYRLDASGAPVEVSL